MEIFKQLLQKVLWQVVVSLIVGGLVATLQKLKYGVITTLIFFLVLSALAYFFPPKHPKEAAPYFTFQQAEMIMEEGKSVELRVDVANNTDSVAENIVTGILVLEGSLDQDIEPLYRGKILHANAEGPGGRFEHVVRFELGAVPPPLFVVFEAQYTGGNNKKTDSQVEFLKVVSGPGTIKNVIAAEAHEKDKIKEYLRERENSVSLPF